jgi:WD40 repeat protein
VISWRSEMDRRGHYGLRKDGNAMRKTRVITRTLRITFFAILATASGLRHGAYGQSETAPSLLIQSGQIDIARSISVSSDGNLLATGNAHEVTVWDLRTRWIVAHLTGPASNVNAVTFSPDGQAVVAGFETGEVVSWTLNDVSHPYIRRANGSSIERIVYYASGNDLFSVGKDDVIRLWDHNDCKNSCELANASGWSISLAVSRDGRWLAIGNADNQLSVWTFDSTTKALNPYKSINIGVSSSEISDQVTGVAISDSGRVAAVTLNGMIRVQNLVPWTEVWTKPTGLALYATTFSPDGAKLFIAGAGFALVGRVLSFQSMTGERVSLAENPQAQTFRALAVSENGRWLVGAGSIGMIWNLETAASPTPLSVHALASRFARLSPSGDSIVVPVTDLHQFSLTRGHFTSVAPSSADERPLLFPVSSTAISQDEQYVVSQGFDRDFLRRVTENCGKLSDQPRLECISKIQQATGDSVMQLLLFRASDPQKASQLGPTIDWGAYPTFSDDSQMLIWRTSSGLETVTVDCACNDRKYPLDTSKGYFAIAVTKTKEFVALPNPLTKGRDVQIYDLAHAKIEKTLPVENPKGSLTALTFDPLPDGTGAQELAAGSSKGDVYIWSSLAAKTPQIIEGKSAIRTMAYSRDGKLLAVGREDGTIDVISRVAGTSFQIPDAHAGAVSSLGYGLDDRWLASAGDDGAIRFWSAKEGRLLGTLIMPNYLLTLTWLFTTPDGLFEGDPRAFDSILWKFSPRLDDVKPVDSYVHDFYRHGLLESVLLQRPLKNQRSLGTLDRRTPVIEMSIWPGDTDTKVFERRAKVKLVVSEAPADKDNQGAGAKDLRLFHNDVLVKQWHGSVAGGHAEFTIEVLLTAGPNQFSAYAFNSDDVKSPAAEAGIFASSKIQRGGITYILAIGVDKYANGVTPLNYSSDDAREFAKVITEHQGAREVVAVTLTDEAATKANILCGLSRLANDFANPPPNCSWAELNRLKPAQPEDSVYVLFSGHGVSANDQFFLLPIGTMINRVSSKNKTLTIENALSDQELERAFEPILARALVLVIDACGAGALLHIREPTPAPLNLDGFSQMANEKGMYVLTAATEGTVAMESPRQSNGGHLSILSYVLVDEGLGRGKADYDPTDGSVTIREWFDYAVRHVPAEADQQPEAFYPFIREDSPVVVVGSATTAQH